MAARKNDKAIGEKAMKMIRGGAKLREVAEACGFTAATAQYYKRKSKGLRGARLYGTKKRRPEGSSEGADLARRVSANCRRWETIARLLREME